MKTFGSSFTCPRFLVSLFVLLVGCKSSPPSDPVDNPPTASISSPSANEVLRGTDTIFVNASDDFAISKVELYMNGSLSSTDNAAPWRFIWDTETVSDGSYTLLVKAYDSRGQIGSSSSVSVTVKNAFPVTFINTTHTPMSITVLSVTRTVQSGDSITYTLTINPRSLVYDASTSGSTSGGTQVGLKFTWGGAGNPIDVSSYESVRLRLQISSTYFFMYISNTGATLSPLYVNYQLSDQTVDYISIPGNGVKYSIGYYKANPGATALALFYPSTTRGVSWTLSFTSVVNQSLWLSNSLSKIGIAASGLEIQAGEIVESSPTLSDQKRHSSVGLNTIAVFQNE